MVRRAVDNYLLGVNYMSAFESKIAPETIEKNKHRLLAALGSEAPAEWYPDPGVSYAEMLLHVGQASFRTLQALLVSVADRRPCGCRGRHLGPLAVSQPVAFAL